MNPNQHEQDKRTLEAIGRIYCAHFHAETSKNAVGLCENCNMAIEATLERTLACPNNHAGNCEDCAHPCQHGDARQNIKAIMAYAAPRMLVRHPIMTLRYLRKKLTKQ